MQEETTKIRTLRTSFHYSPLDENAVSENPVVQFNKWMTDALKAHANEPNAMTLATIDRKGFPEARVVLLRGVGKGGFTFFTNYKSAKGQELRSGKACLNFFWPELTRQVRIVGKVKKLSARESNSYFNSRPRENQISACVSNQSEVIKGRDELEKKYLLLEKKFQNKKVPRPTYWGGYAVIPVSIEFWQGRQNRLHDRLRYTKMTGGKWKLERLAP